MLSASIGKGENEGKDFLKIKLNPTIFQNEVICAYEAASLLETLEMHPNGFDLIINRQNINVWKRVLQNFLLNHPLNTENKGDAK